MLHRCAAIISLGWLINWALYTAMMCVFVVYCCVLLAVQNPSDAQQAFLSSWLLSVLFRFALQARDPVSDPASIPAFDPASRPTSDRTHASRAAGAGDRARLVRGPPPLRHRVHGEPVRRDRGQRPPVAFDTLFAILAKLAHPA